MNFLTNKSNNSVGKDIAIDQLIKSEIFELLPVEPHTCLLAVMYEKKNKNYYTFKNGTAVKRNVRKDIYVDTFFSEYCDKLNEVEFLEFFNRMNFDSPNEFKYLIDLMNLDVLFDTVEKDFHLNDTVTIYLTLPKNDQGDSFDLEVFGFSDLYAFVDDYCQCKIDVNSLHLI